MYCPHCGREMQLLNGVFTCVNGQMALSQILQKQLTERFPFERPRSQRLELGKKLGRWFCTGCGTLLGPGIVCNDCGQTLRDLHFQLVDLHPHASE